MLEKILDLTDEEFIAELPDSDEDGESEEEILLRLRRAMLSQIPQPTLWPVGESD